MVPKQSWKKFPDAKGIETFLELSVDEVDTIGWKKFPDAKGIETDNIAGLVVTVAVLEEVPRCEGD